MASRAAIGGQKLLKYPIISDVAAQVCNYFIIFVLDKNYY